MNAVEPLTPPERLTGAPLVKGPATGVPASTATVMTCSVVLTPLNTLMVKVSVVDPVAVWRWAWLGV